MDDIRGRILDTIIKSIQDDDSLARLTMIEWGAIVRRKSCTVRLWLRRYERAGHRVEKLYGNGVGMTISRKDAGLITRFQLSQAPLPYWVLHHMPKNEKGQFTSTKHKKGRET